MTPIFQAPPLTPEILGALKLIAPELEVFDCTEESRLAWQESYEFVNAGEYAVLEPVLSKLAPKRVLEIGPGMGRSLVYLNTKCTWMGDRVLIDAYEGNGNTTRYTLLGPRLQDSWCGNIGVLEQILKHNDIDNVKVFDARDIKLVDLPGPYDLIYSFYGVGFHWRIEYFIDDIHSLMHESSVGIFMVYHEFEPFGALDDYHWRLLDIPGLPDNPKFLILSESPLAQ